MTNTALRCGYDTRGTLWHLHFRHVYSIQQVSGLVTSCPHRHVQRKRLAQRFGYKHWSKQLDICIAPGNPSITQSQHDIGRCAVLWGAVQRQPCSSTVYSATCGALSTSSRVPTSVCTQTHTYMYKLIQGSNTQDFPLSTPLLPGKKRRCQQHVATSYTKEGQLNLHLHATKPCCLCVCNKP